jgi:2-polyprenyl-3-methyl-5-hydroxy-6-metoxy-1,4-benzoquinol methylase
MDSSYERKLADEAEFWGGEAEKQAHTTPPDWRYHRELRHNRVIHGTYVEDFLSQILPGMTALELGCSAGWLTLAMAQRGAQVTGLDISEKALEVARTYYGSIRHEVRGSVAYEAADLNNLTLPPHHYDVIAIKGTLHHLVNLRHVMEQLDSALKPGGFLWVADSHGEETMSSVLVASALMFLLPTQVSYRDKIRGLLRFRTNAPARIKASIEAQGLSAFEGAGREHDWLGMLEERFIIERRIKGAAFTGYISAQLKAPDRLAIPFLRMLHKIDCLLVRLGLLRSTGVLLYARKR